MARRRAVPGPIAVVLMPVSGAAHEHRQALCGSGGHQSYGSVSPEEKLQSGAASAVMAASGLGLRVPLAASS